MERPKMPPHGLATIAELSAMITAGRVLLVAGHESLLKKLPAGKWIAGTATQFMTEAGTVTDTTRIFYSDLTRQAGSVKILALDSKTLPDIASGYPDNGFSIIILPGGSLVLGQFARFVQEQTEIFNAPLTGWVSVPLGGKASVFAGSRQPLTEHAAVMHVTLPPEKAARLEVINLFSPSKTAILEFDAEGFSATDCKIDGQVTNLAAYLAARNIDQKLPLLADYHGAMLNVSLAGTDATGTGLAFYKPVFKDAVYRFANPIPDYPAAFAKALKDAQSETPAFACNSNLNVLYAQLEARPTPPFQGPITNGEIAYILLNQTLVYLTIDTIEE